MGLKPIKRKFRTKLLWGFDVETEVNDGKHKFIMGSIVGDEGINRTFYDRKDFFKFILDNYRLFRRGYIVATNLNFDIMELVKGTKYRVLVKPLIRSSSMLCVKIPVNNGHDMMTFIDSWNHFKLGVEKMGRIIGINKLNKPSFLGKKPKNNLERLELEEYNMTDSVITYKFMRFIQGTYNRLDANLKMTIASSTMDLFRRNDLKEELYQPDKPTMDMIFKAYYGGRTEIFKRGKIKNLNYYDVNSLYPSVMLEAMPHPNFMIPTKKVTLRNINENEGVCKVRLTAPNMKIPYLPVRTEDKLIFPYGEIEGYYTFLDIREAVKRGYKIKYISEGVVYTKMFYPFKTFVKRLYRLRLFYQERNDTREKVVKVLMNSLYGKFGQKIDSKETIIHEKALSYKDMKKAIKINKSGEYYILNSPCEHIPSFVNPIFCAYVTSYARRKLYSFMQKVGFDHVYYCDTDSIITDKTLIHSNVLGKMKLEFNITKGVLVKPKMYMIDDIIKFKGVHDISKEEFLHLINGDTKSIINKKFLKFKEAGKRHKSYNEIVPIEKFISLEDNKRLWTENFNPSELQDSEPLKTKVF